MMLRSPERLAWFTLIGAQVICLMIAAVSLGSSWWFFFDSSVDLTTELQVSRGTVGVLRSGSTSPEAVRDRLRLNNGDSILTDDDTSQANIAFIDSNHDDRVVANVTVFSGSQAALASAKRPRFSLTDGDYQIQLSHQHGRLEIEIPPDLTHDIQLEVQGRNAQVRLHEPGFYIVTSNEESTRVFVRAGNALIKPYEGELTHVPAGHTAVVDTERRTANLIIQRIDLLEDPLFTIKTAGQPSAWTCEPPLGDPPGSHQSVQLEGRDAMYLERDSDQGYARVQCNQYFAQMQGEGLDVSGYRSLKIRATLKIGHQTVLRCGGDGSECPLMLAVVFETAQQTPEGEEVIVENIWYHGFYAFDQDQYPDFCASCIEPHNRITPDTWYTYESSNMLQFPEAFQPDRIKQISFYSSGHAFDVVVGEVALIAESN